MSTLKHLTLGNVIACVMSYTYHHSILLALLHGLLGWVYVILAVIF